MKLAIVGSGIAGLTAAHVLAPHHEITLFEAQSHIGGHTLTSDVPHAGGTLPVDAGFIVYNEARYPNFVRLLDRLRVETQPSSMSFSVRCDRTRLEYAGTSFNTLFAQRSNLLRPDFYRLLRQILRFNRAARRALAEGFGGNLASFLRRHQLTARLAEHYLIPLTAAIWSTDPRRVLDAPARFILGFLDNHNLLGTRGYHPWRVIRGGSARYVERLVAAFRDRVHLSTPVRRIERLDSGVRVRTDADSAVFDQVIVAAHSDQALGMLDRPTGAERAVLGAIRYQPNRATLHTDAAVLPERRRAWASWNYRVPRDRERPVALTYNMTRLQTLPTDTPYCVSLNLDDEISPRLALRRFEFEHPVFTEDAVAAQARHEEISGADRIHYCGAYWRNGFHEDGVVSALRVTRSFGLTL